MWNPINCKTHFSLQQGFCKADKLAKRCAEYGYTACGIADFGTLSGAVDFQQECKQHGIKAIIAVLSHVIGVFASRWLFFAEAEHVVGLYYGKRG